MENTRVVNQSWAVLRYDGTYYQNDFAMPIKDYRPKEGQLVFVKNTPFFQGYPVMVHGYDNKTIEELVQIAFQSASAAEIQAAILEEMQARAQADNALLSDLLELRAIAQGAGVAIAFDNHAQLAAWMAGQVMPFTPPFLPSQLKTGIIALFRSTGESDLWYDGEAGQWWEKEGAALDLTGYRTKAAQDELDALKAPLESPALTGIPTAPEPDYTIDSQVATVQAIKDLRNLIFATVFPRSRICAPAAFIPELRVTMDGFGRGVLL